MIGGGLVGKVGYFQPFLMLGAGLGTSIQVPVISAQEWSSLSDIALVTASILFFQLSSSAFAVSATQSIFNNHIISNLADFAPEITRGQIIQAGSTGILENFAKEEVLGVLLSFMAGLKAAWAMGIALAVGTLAVSFLPEWSSIKGSGAGGVMA